MLVTAHKAETPQPGLKRIQIQTPALACLAIMKTLLCLTVEFYDYV